MHQLPLPTCNLWVYHLHCLQGSRWSSTASCCGPPAATALLFSAASPLQPTPHRVGEPFELHGLILRSTLLQLLRSRRGFVDPQQAATLLGRRHSSADLLGGGAEGSARGPGRPVLSAAGGGADYAAAAAQQQLE